MTLQLIWPQSTDSQYREWFWRGRQDFIWTYVEDLSSKDYIYSIYLFWYLFIILFDKSFNFLPPIPEGHLFSFCATSGHTWNTVIRSMKIHQDLRFMLQIEKRPRTAHHLPSETVQHTGGTRTKRASKQNM